MHDYHDTRRKIQRGKTIPLCSMEKAESKQTVQKMHPRKAVP